MADQLFNLKFVAEVEKRPELYNYTLKMHAKKGVTERAWGEVADQVQLKVSECKVRWRNLRAVLGRHLKPSARGSGKKAKKPYYLWEAMKFMIPYIKTLEKPVVNLPKAPRESNEPNSTQQTFDISQEEAEGEEDLSVREAPLIPSLAPQTAKSSQERTSLSMEMKQELGFGPREDLTRKRNEQTSADEDFVNAKKKKLFATSNGTGLGKQAFLLSLLPEIEPMTDAQMKLFRRRVLKLIDDIIESD